MFGWGEARRSTCRSFETISSGLYRFLAIAVLLDVKDIPQVGPLQWGRIKPIQWQPIRPWKTICECGIVGNLLPTFHCRRSLPPLPGAAQRYRLGGPFSRRPRNLLEQPRIQASTFRGYPRIALWNTGATDDTVVTANIIHLPLPWRYPMSAVLRLRSCTCRCCHQQYGSPN